MLIRDMLEESQTKFADITAVKWLAKKQICEVLKTHIEYGMGISEKNNP